MSQAKGSNAQLLIYKEATFGVSPTLGVNHAYSLPFNTIGLKAERNLITPATIRSGRNALQAAQGDTKVSGSLVMPPDLRNIGFILQGLIGAPSAGVQVAAKNLNNGAAAVNVGSGVVGLPCTAHGFQAGETITIANTTNYNGDAVVLASSTTDQVNITKTYVAENMGASSTARAKRYTHTFKVATSLYSYLLDVGYTDIGQFFKYLGVKFDKFSMKVGGDQELTYSLDVVGCTENISQSAYDPAPTSLNFTRLSSFQASLLEGGSSIANVTEFELNISNNLDPSKPVIGSGGFIGGISEGICNTSGSINAFFENLTLYNKAINATESSLQLALTYGVHSLTFNIAELVYKRSAPGVNTQGGIYISLPFDGYYGDDAAASVVVATLVNDVATYVWP